MDNSSCEIRIYDPDFNWAGEARAATSVQFSREWQTAGTFEIHIHPDSSGARELATPGNVIIINKDGHKSGVVRDFEYKKSTATTGGEDLVVYGSTGAGFAHRRLTVPPNAQQDPNALGFDKINAPAETVIKHYAAMNMVTPYDPKRVIERLIIADDRGRGVSVPWKSRYLELCDELRLIGEYADMGWEIYADAANKQWVFDVATGTDRTRTQWRNSQADEGMGGGVSPVTFSLDYSNLDEISYSENRLQYRNAIYCGGQGEDENRLIYILGNETPAEPGVGRERYETFLDLGNSQNISELIYYGTQKIADFAAVNTVAANALPRVFMFEKDYFLGDKVTLQIPKIGLDIDTRVSAVKEVWEPVTGYRLETRFGGSLPTAYSVLRVNQQKEVR